MPVSATQDCLFSATDWHSISLNSIYASIGVDADWTIGTVDYSVRVLDKSKGMSIGKSEFNTPIIVPAAVIRSKELDCLGLLDSLGDIINSEITVNGLTHNIVNYKVIPGPFGQGEYALIFRDDS